MANEEIRTELKDIAAEMERCTVSGQVCHTTHELSINKAFHSRLIEEAKEFFDDQGTGTGLLLGMNVSTKMEQKQPWLLLSKTPQ